MMEDLAEHIDRYRRRYFTLGLARSESVHKMNYGPWLGELSSAVDRHFSSNTSREGLANSRTMAFFISRGE